MNATPRKVGLKLPQMPPDLQAPLRAALDVAFALTTPDAVIVGPVTVPAAPEKAPVPMGHPIPLTDAGNSRIAMMVLHEEPWRQRALRRLGPLLAEYSVNTDSQTRRDLADEASLGRPVTAQWLAAGTVAYDPLGRGQVLVQHAALLLTRGFKPSEAELGGRRVQALIGLNDARMRIASDPIIAELMLARAIEEIIDFAFAANGRWLPAPVERRAALLQLDRAAASLLEGCFQGYDVAANIRAAERLAERLLGMRAAPDWIGPRLVASTAGL